MTDRELLELAAKAAGMIPKSFVGNADYMDGLLSGRNPWNPLADDGDAFSLALALKLNIMQGDFSASVNDEADIDIAAFVRDDGDRPSVVRRLIVDAAAAAAMAAKP